MGKLLKFEFRRLFSQKSFYICTAILILINAVLIKSSWSARVSAGLNGEGFVQQSLINSGTTFLFVILLGVFAALFVCEDYSIGTIRVIVTRGYSRTQIYFAKLIVICAGSLIMLFVCWFSALLTAELAYDGAKTSMNVKFLLAMSSQIVLVIAYACLFCAISSAIQKTGGSLALCIVLPMAVTILLTAIETAVSIKNPDSEIELCKYWLERMISDVSIVDPPMKTLGTIFAATPVYIIVTTALGWLSVFKREY